MLKTPLVVRIPEVERDRLDALAAEAGVTRSELVRAAIAIGAGRIARHPKIIAAL